MNGDFNPSTMLKGPEHRIATLGEGIGQDENKGIKESSFFT